MKEFDKRQFTKSLTKVGYYYGRVVSIELSDIYWDNLKNFEFKDIETALSVHYHQPEEGRFFPKIADLVRILEGLPESRALIAWTRVYSYMCSVGCYQSVIFDDHLIHAVIADMGGWIHLCTRPLKELSFVAIEFQKRYRAYLIRPVFHYPRYLVGFFELKNAAQGYPVVPPLLLGDTRLAETVFREGASNRLTVQTASQSIQKLICQIKAIEQTPPKKTDEQFFLNKGDK